MKNWILYFLLSIVTVFLACQEEERELINPDMDTTIPRNSQLADLMTKVSIHDGSYDDVVDNGHCFSINLPYSIILDGEEYVIDELSDYDILNDNSSIEIIFPLKITFSNHIERILDDIIALQDLAKTCSPQDDDIECIDFVYPITFSTFDSTRNRLETLDIGHDSAMFEFMSKAETNISISINYPINLLLYNGQTIAAQHNIALEDSIKNAVFICDENDN